MAMLRRAAASLASSPSPLRAVGVRAVSTGYSVIPHVRNETFQDYAPGSASRAGVEAALKRLLSSPPASIPVVIDGVEEHFDGTADDYYEQRAPTDIQRVVSKGKRASKEHIHRAIKGALKAREQWQKLDFADRAAVFLKAADLLSTKYRYDVIAATMIGTGKNVYQAEIDAAVETIDFWRFNAKYAEQIYRQQPPENSFGVWNRMDYRPLNGFIAAISPFNFLAIGSNLCCAPAQMGNVSLWKPAESTALGSYLIYQILREAGLPDGVIQFLPGGADVGMEMVKSRDMAGLHFTGSTRAFDTLWQTIGSRIHRYRNYPRIVGETGGKNFMFIHPSASDLSESIINQVIRGAFEYNGQKCSATSRMYVPQSIWEKIRDPLVERTKSLKMGQPQEMDTFITAVINEASFDRVTEMFRHVTADTAEYRILCGGKGDKSVGYFIEPTIIECKSPDNHVMNTEWFAPVISVVVYPDNAVEKAVKMCKRNENNYALTGAIFARDRLAIAHLSEELRDAAGNLYINDKSTGSLVGQQPFGGAGRSGTNDKSGSLISLLRWTSARAIKDNFLPLENYGYPHMRA